MDTSDNPTATESSLRYGVMYVCDIKKVNCARLAADLLSPLPSPEEDCEGNRKTVLGKMGHFEHTS